MTPLAASIGVEAFRWFAGEATDGVVQVIYPDPGFPAYDARQCKCLVMGWKLPAKDAMLNLHKTMN